MSDEDLVRRLRASILPSNNLKQQAADAIERLTRERDVTHLIAVRAERKVEKLRAALCCVGNIAHAEGDAAGICDVVTAALAETEKGDE